MKLVDLATGPDWTTATSSTAAFTQRTSLL